MPFYELDSRRKAQPPPGVDSQRCMIQPPPRFPDILPICQGRRRSLGKGGVGLLGTGEAGPMPSAARQCGCRSPPPTPTSAASSWWPSSGFSAVTSVSPAPPPFLYFQTPGQLGGRVCSVSGQGGNPLPPCTLPSPGKDGGRLKGGPKSSKQSFNPPPGKLPIFFSREENLEAFLRFAGGQTGCLL